MVIYFGRNDNSADGIESSVAIIVIAARLVQSTIYVISVIAIPSWMEE
jgi:hypothetical protein